MVQRLALRVPKFVLEEFQVLTRRIQIRFVAQHGRRTRNRAEHHAIPRREHFVIQVRPHAFRARLEHFVFRRVQQLLLRSRDVRVDET